MAEKKKRQYYIPVTPAGTMLFDIIANSEEEAIRNLLHAASHMPYKTWDNFQKRGYTIEVKDYKPY